MKQLALFYVMVLLSISAMGCSSAQTRIMPGEGEKLKVVATDYAKDDAAEAAVDAANDWCEDRKKAALFYSESDPKYLGALDEKTTAGVRVASTMGWAMGIEGAGMAGYAATADSKYEVQMTFSCR